MKPYDIVRPTEMGILDIVWKVEEVKVKLPSVESGYSYSERIGENNYEVSKCNTLLLMNINHILKPDTFTILA